MGKKRIYAMKMFSKRVSRGQVSDIQEVQEDLRVSNVSKVQDQKLDT
jgi:hypothetical protein